MVRLWKRLLKSSQFYLFSPKSQITHLSQWALHHSLYNMQHPLSLDPYNSTCPITDWPDTFFIGIFLIIILGQGSLQTYLEQQVLVVSVKLKQYYLKIKNRNGQKKSCVNQNGERITWWSLFTIQSTMWPWTCPEHRDLYKPRWDVVSCLCCWKLDASTQFRRRIESVSCVILERLKKKLTFCSTVHYIIVLYPGFSLIYLQNVLICFPCPMSVDFSTCLHTKSFTLLSLC